MNISYNWLRDYLHCDIEPQALSTILTSIGLEVGQVEKVETIKGGLYGLVVGEVCTCIEHPNSDHLHITTVDVGQDELLQIVCGAANIAAGQKVVVATIGTKLYQGEESFTIKRSKIRGEESFGMICAEDEIGIGTSHDGIMVLPADTAVGLSVRELFNVKEDTLIEVDITPNRADAISHFGIARDLAAYLKTHQLSGALLKPSVENFKVHDTTLQVDVEVKNIDSCPRYAGLTIADVTVKESPQWLQDRLNTIGVRPINNVVDATNYVLHAFGQPLHAFDLAKIEGNRIEVKNVTQGTKFKTLDGVERTLSDNDLMICDVKKPMCIAGVFGGLDAGVTDQTKNIFLESAYFNPVAVRRTARYHGLSTDSSFRFERGVDPANIIYALKYAALLIQEVAGGRIASEVIDFYPKEIPDFEVTLTRHKIRTLIGQEISEKTLDNIFKGLEIKILESSEESYRLRVPAYRVDVQRDVDVIEDILRLYGYNNIVLSDSLHSNLSYSQRPESHVLQTQISEQLTANGFNEILNNSLTKGDYYKSLTTYPLEQSVKLLNPLNNDLNVMRQTLLFGGLESIAHNTHRQYADLKFYEFGNCYTCNKEAKTLDNALNAYTEQSLLALWVTGKSYPQSWLRAQEPTSFYFLKAFVQNILSRAGLLISDLVQKEFSSDIYTQALMINSAQGKTLAILGEVNASICKEFDIMAPVFFAEISWKGVLDASVKHEIKYREISKYPEVKRDLALLVDQEVTFSQIEAVAYATERKLLKQVTLFDVYEGKNLPEKKKSYAINFVLQDNERTLTDKQIDIIMQKLIKNYQEKLGAQLR